MRNKLQKKLLRLAHNLHNTADYEHAEELLLIYLAEYSLDFEAMVLLAICYQKQNRIDLAEKQIETCRLIPNLILEQTNQLNNLIEQFKAPSPVGENFTTASNNNENPTGIREIIRDAVSEAVENQARAPLYLRDPGHEYLLTQRLKNSRRFDQKVFAEATPHATWLTHMKANLARTDIAGYYLEFGVHRGLSINELARMKPEKTIYGFDSFVGFPEAWSEFPAGSMSLDGIPPDTRENVQLFKGWFEDTLPVFLTENKADAAFIHIDCDLYSSTQTVLRELAPRIKIGTVIVFDDYLPDEITAFKDFVELQKIKYKYISYHLHDYNERISLPHSVSIIISDK